MSADLIYAQRGGNNELFMPIYVCQAGLHVNCQKHTPVRMRMAGSQWVATETWTILLASVWLLAAFKPKP